MNDKVKNAIHYFKENKISITKCAKMFGIHRETLVKYLKLENAHEDRRSYAIDKDYFNSIDTEAKAYWLGFILADGCIKKEGCVSIGLSYKDVDHLEKLKNAVQSDRPIVIETRNAFDNTYETCTFVMQNMNITNALRRYGIENHKSCNEKLSDLIPEHLMRHYIRGIYDGDGWITWNLNNHTYEIGIGMGEECLLGIKAHLESIGVKEYPVKAYRNISRYRITSKKEIRKTLDYLYQDATVYLDRKYMRFIDFCRLEPKANTTEDSR